MSTTAETKKKLADLKEQAKIQKEIFETEYAIKMMKQNKDRGRSLTVGTAFGGTTEISIRGDSESLWILLQPAEVTEIIHQLAGAIGCHINIQPRHDFASWRNWKDVDNGSSLIGWAPYMPMSSQDVQIGAKLPPPAEQPGLNINKETIRRTEDAVATKKTINKRKSKPTPTAS